MKRRRSASLADLLAAFVVITFAASIVTATVTNGDEPRVSEGLAFPEDQGTDGISDALTTLRIECGRGDMDACDDLYFRSPGGSNDEEFGSTCGDRTVETEGDCREFFPEDP